eukprot:COSAG02_NODE_3411_length_6786_cov_70.963511_6_plen_172_part_00
MAGKGKRAISVLALKNDKQDDLGIAGKGRCTVEYWQSLATKSRLLPLTLLPPVALRRIRISISAAQLNRRQHRLTLHSPPLQRRRTTLLHSGPRPQNRFRPSTVWRRDCHSHARPPFAHKHCCRPRPTWQQPGHLRRLWRQSVSKARPSLPYDPPRNSPTSNHHSIVWASQ